MLKYNRDDIDFGVLTRIARETIASFDAKAPESLASMLPAKFVEDIEYEIEGIHDNRVVAANWRTFGGSTTSETFGKTSKGRGMLQPLSREFTLSEETLLRQKHSKIDYVGRDIDTLTVRAAQALAIEINVQRANAIAHGYIELQTAGTKTQKLDFGRKAEFNTTAPHLFTDKKENPLEYIATLCDQYEDVNHRQPEKIMIPKKILRLIYNNPEVAKIANNNAFITHANKGKINQVMDDYELPQIEVLNDYRYLKDDLTDGSVKEYHLFPQDSIYLVPERGDVEDPDSSIFGQVLWGEPLHAEKVDFKGTSAGEMAVPGAVVFVEESGWPSNVRVVADALAIPVLFNPNLVIKAKVI